MNLQSLYILWFIILIIVEAKITCHFEDDGQMFHICNGTDYDNVLHRGLVSDKRKTFHIVLNRCEISSIDLEAFYRLPALVILDLAENKIQSLEQGVFDRLVALSRLDLSDNLLTELPVGIFSKLHELSELDLGGNKLITLTPGIFDYLPRLYRLDLSKNFITGKNLSTSVFIKRRDLTILNLSGNDMTEAIFLPIMYNLNYLFLDQCGFQEVPKFSTAENMKKLRHLSLASNEIQSIDDETIFNNLIEVMVLNLTINGIEFIHENAFKGLSDLEELDLRFNKLKVIPVSMFQNMRKLYDLRLSFNSLRDVPLNAFAGSTELKKLSFSYNNITHLHENFLLKIEDAGLMLKFMDFSNNPWQCACLKDLMREVKEMEVRYNAEYYDGEHPVCVTTKKFICKRDAAVDEEFINMYNDAILEYLDMIFRRH